MQFKDVPVGSRIQFGVVVGRKIEPAPTAQSVIEFYHGHGYTDFVGWTFIEESKLAERNGSFWAPNDDTEVVVLN